MKKSLKILVGALIFLIVATGFVGYNYSLSKKKPERTGCTEYTNHPVFYNLPEGHYMALQTDEEWDVIAAVASRPGDAPYDKPEIPGACSSLEPNIVKPKRNYILVDQEGVPHKVEYFIGRCIKNCTEDQSPLP